MNVPSLGPYQSKPAPRGGETAQSGADSAVAQAHSGARAQSAEGVRQVIAAINRAAKSLNNSVELSLDTQSGQPVVRVMDTETGQLIRQIPSVEVMELRRALDRMAGMLINRTA